MTTIDHRKITQACDILFGENFKADSATFDYLQVSGLKTAYRQRVKSCHPDLNKGNEERYESDREFCEVKEAYEFLLSMKTMKCKQKRFTSNERFYTSFIPMRKLKLAEYLYYSGTISWNNLINSIVWHKKNSLRIGNYFIREGILKSDELALKLVKMNLHNHKFK